MRILVCGNHGWTDYDAIRRRLAQIPGGRPTIVRGAAAGADNGRSCSEGAAPDRGALALDLATPGKRTGVLRNEQMLDTGGGLVIAFWEGQSRRTQHTIESAKRPGIPIDVIGK